MYNSWVPKPIALMVMGLLLAMAFPADAQDKGKGHRELLGPRFALAPTHQVKPRPRSRPGLNWIRNWNEIALDANALDHTPVAEGDIRVSSGEQYGPRAYEQGIGDRPYRHVRRGQRDRRWL
jgi:hypothetical protein